MRNRIERLVPFAPAGVAVGLAATLLGLHLGTYALIAGGLLGAALAAVVATRPQA